MIHELSLEATDKVRFISDLHLGHPKTKITDVRQLQFLFEDCTHLVVCGDLCEDRPSPYQEIGREMREAFISMSQNTGVKLILLAGNHDPNEEASILHIKEQKLYALHGHALFKNIAPWGWEYLKNKKLCHELICSYPDADTNIYSRLELARKMSLIVPPIFHQKKKTKNKLLGFLLHSAWPPERPIQIIRAWLTMLGKMHQFSQTFFNDSEIVIFGHFHRRAYSYKKNRLCLNLGACFHHAQSYAADLMPDGSLFIRSYTPNGFDAPAQKIRS